ncbi:MAG: FAD-linked oxidase C-terminal domain-containing protein [Candidatus Hydrogenedentota bacterium]
MPTHAPLNNSTRRAIQSGAPCEFLFDDHTRQMFATDGSIYQVEPMGVAFPRNAAEASAVIERAAEADVSVTPRGAGTGLAGGALGPGLILHAARYNQAITDLDIAKGTVHVGAGVILDQLNAYLKPHGLQFGPDVATSSRATLGGMIANNSSGARTPLYGVTADHVVSVDAVMADGRVVTISRDSGALPDEEAAIRRITGQYGAAIRERCPEGLIKRWPGYGLERWVRKPGNLADILAGSEGTLALIMSAELELTPLPQEKGLALIFFPSVTEAMAATVSLTDLQPAAIEHIDRVLFDQTRGQHAFRQARALMELDEKPCESILIVEFYDDDVAGRLETVRQRNLGERTLLTQGAAEMAMVWEMRKAGLSLLTGCKGPAKPVTGIEDTAVRPDQLPDYVNGLHEIMEPLGVHGSFYGHAASGLLHVRPVLDLHEKEDIAKHRRLAEEVSGLVKQFKGSIAAEHGVGIARTEFLPEHMGEDLMAAMTQVKDVFDPERRMNPGKIIGDGTYRFDRDLRWGDGYAIPTPFDPVLGFVDRDESFVNNLEQCNGAGACVKLDPSMCPTYIATGKEIMSTRGRANTIRAVLDGRLRDSRDPLLSPALHEALSNCLACKACKVECPSNVDLALLKAELLHARQQKHGLSFGERVLSNPDRLGRLGCLAPGLVNRSLQWGWVKKVTEKLIGVSQQRTLPPFTRQRFDRWFVRRTRPAKGHRGTVVLWDDTSVRYYEPQIGQAAVKVLEAAGYEVKVARNRACCGRPAFSVGRIDHAAACGQRNLRLLSEDFAGLPILFLEPSCCSMFRQDYRELKLEGAGEVAERCYLFEEFMLELLESDPEALPFSDGYHWVAIHAHCHAKTLVDTKLLERLARFLPNNTVTTLNTTCCGMAGTFGMRADKYDLSIQTGRHLADQVQNLQAGTSVIATGTSCRGQIDDMTDTAALHIAELFADALDNG